MGVQIRNTIAVAIAFACMALVLLHGCSSADEGVSAGRGDGSGPTPPGQQAEDGTGNGSAVVGAPNAPALVPVTVSGQPSGQESMEEKAPPPTALTSEPIAIDDCGTNNPASLTTTDVERLKAGGSADGMRLVYPYEGTVFPRGMLAPDVMWEGAPAADAVYVHIKSQIYEYWGCLKPSQPAGVTLPQEPWERAGERSRGKQDFYEMEVSVLSGGMVFGPLKTTVQVAQAAIKGSIFYNTYRSSLTGAAADPAAGFGGGLPVGGIGGANGIVVRIPPGGSAEVFGQTDCNGCHSVSADGSRLLAQSVVGGTYSYEIVDDGPAPTPAMAGGSGSWSAVYPDGSAYLAMSTATDVARAGIFGGLSGGSPDATLYDATTGQVIPSMGIPPGALMPFFSPDGRFLVFNDFALGDARGIVLMSYDTATHSATNYEVLYEEPAGAVRPAWPFVLPDNNGVVFLRTDDFDFTGGGVGVIAAGAPGTVGLGGFGGGGGGPFGELSVIDLATKQVTLLARAMGYNTLEDAQQGTTYLPYGDEDLSHHYYPTVSPVAAGGYFWVFFDSIRHYGNLGVQRQLWGAAIDIAPDGSYTRDPSYPAFYLTGQEFGTGNHRAFAALDACRKDGDMCTSGIDCCGGFCYTEEPYAEFGVQPVGTCSPKINECSRRDEKCLTDADCCPPLGEDYPDVCIAGFCAQVPQLL